MTLLWASRGPPQPQPLTSLWSARRGASAGAADSSMENLVSGYKPPAIDQASTSSLTGPDPRDPHSLCRKRLWLVTSLRRFAKGAPSPVSAPLDFTSSFSGSRHTSIRLAAWTSGVCLTRLDHNSHNDVSLLALFGPGRTQEIVLRFVARPRDRMNARSTSPP